MAKSKLINMYYFCLCVNTCFIQMAPKNEKQSCSVAQLISWSLPSLGFQMGYGHNTRKAQTDFTFKGKKIHATSGSNCNLPEEHIN